MSKRWSAEETRKVIQYARDGKEIEEIQMLMPKRSTFAIQKQLSAYALNSVFPQLYWRAKNIAINCTSNQ